MPTVKSLIRAESGLELPSDSTVVTPGWTIPRVNSFPHIVSDMGYPSSGTAITYEMGYTSFNTNTEGYLHYRCRLPYPCKLNHIVAYISGAGGHAVPPAQKPVISASLRTQVGTLWLNLGSRTDPTTSGAVFDSLHEIIMPVITSPLELDITGPTYLSVMVGNEYGANSQPGLQVFVINAYLAFDQLPIW